MGLGGQRQDPAALIPANIAGASFTGAVWDT
jgi:hypothetical protein